MLTESTLGSWIRHRVTRAVALAAGTIGMALLVSCGGGGGSGGSIGTGGGGSGPAVNVMPMVVDSGPTVPPGFNCTPYATYGCTVGQPINSANTAYVSVKVCLPGTTRCMTIDHVSVDTGSSGLRLEAGAVAALTASDGTSGSAFLAAMPGTGNAVSSSLTTAECVQFGSGYTFGPVTSLDVYLITNNGSSSEKAASLNVQIAGGTLPSTVDAQGATGPLSSCESGLASMNDLFAMGANGLIGVGMFVNDCVTGANCLSGQGANQYFGCNVSGCSEVTVSSTQQVANPVATLVASDTGTLTDNKGVILSLPAVDSAGMATVTGSLILGVGTRSNNSLSASQSVLLAGYSSTTLPGAGYDTGDIDASLSVNSPASVENAFGGTGDALGYNAYSFLDSGSNGYFLPISGAPCDTTYGWYASSSPTATTPYPLTYNVTLVSSSDPNSFNTTRPSTGVSTTITLQSETNTYTSTAAALPGFSAPLGGCTAGVAGVYSTAALAYTTNTANTGIDLGLPFFYGRNIAVVYENAAISKPTGGSSTTYFGPLWAF